MIFTIHHHCINLGRFLPTKGCVAYDFNKNCHHNAQQDEYVLIAEQVKGILGGAIKGLILY